MMTLLETWGVWGAAMIVAGVLLVMWGLQERGHVPERWREHVGIGRITGGIVLLAAPVVALLVAFVLTVGLGMVAPR